MGLRPTKGDESRSVVRPVADAPGSVTEPEHGTPSVSEGPRRAARKRRRRPGRAATRGFRGAVIRRQRRRLHFQNHGHDQRVARRLLDQKALQVDADLLLHHAPVAALFRCEVPAFAQPPAAPPASGPSRPLGDKAAADDLRQPLGLAGVLVDRDDRQHEAVFGKMAPVADDHVLDHFVKRARIDADAAHGDPLALARAAVGRISSVWPVSRMNVSSSPECRRCCASCACFASCRYSPWIGMKYFGRTRLSISFSSSALACPETCTGGFMRAVDHVRAALGASGSSSGRWPSRCPE